jgi:hypothetical protein
LRKLETYLTPLCQKILKNMEIFEGF